MFLSYLSSLFSRESQEVDPERRSYMEESWVDVVRRHTWRGLKWLTIGLAVVGG
jgi:hypothetical protein